MIKDFVDFKLYGFINQSNSIPSFLAPVFIKEDGAIYLQRINEHCELEGFDIIQIQNPDADIIKITGSRKHTALPCFAFQLPDKTIIFNSKEKLCLELKNNFSVINKFDFLFIEVLDFMGDEQAMSRQIKAIKDRYNNDLISRWADIQNKIIGNPQLFCDKTLTCKDCGAEFVFSAGEQEFYAEKGFQNEPLRCKSCRNNRVSQRNGQQEMRRDPHTMRRPY